MLKKLSFEQLEQLKSERDALLEEVCLLTKNKTKIEPELMRLKNKYLFLYNETFALFNLIIRDFSTVKPHFLESEKSKFYRDQNLLFNKLQEHAISNESHYENSKKFEEEYRQIYFPQNLKDELKDLM
jgi:hypothetical protein